MCLASGVGGGREGEGGLLDDLVTRQRVQRPTSGGTNKGRRVGKQADGQLTLTLLRIDWNASPLAGDGQRGTLWPFYCS